MTTSETVIEKKQNKCSDCWQEVSDTILNEVVVIGLECNEIQRKIRLIEKFISKRWNEVKDNKG